MPDIDHRRMLPPFLRLQSSTETPAGTLIGTWDLRIAQPNVTTVSAAVLHSLEHLLNVYFRDSEKQVFLVSLLGCHTGLYLSTLNVSTHNHMAALLKPALAHILIVNAVPLATEIDCGAAAMHDLVGAQRVAAWLLSRLDDWGKDEIDTDLVPATWKDAPV